MDTLLPAAQLNIKIPAALKAAFDRCLDDRRESQREVLERCIEVYVAQCTGREVLHLDGSTCPLSQLVIGLTNAAKAQLAGEKVKHKFINKLTELTPTERATLEVNHEYVRATADLSMMIADRPDKEETLRAQFEPVALTIARKIFC